MLCLLYIRWTYVWGPRLEAVDYERLDLLPAITHPDIARRAPGNRPPLGEIVEVEAANIVVVHGDQESRMVGVPSSRGVLCRHSAAYQSTAGIPRLDESRPLVAIRLAEAIPPVYYI